MKTILTVLAAILAFSFAANAQDASNSANQTVQLSLTNALEISFTGTGTATGSTVNIPFSSVTNYTNGVETAAQELRVRSNNNFNVTVKTSSANFTGTNNGVSNMPVSGVLKLMVSSNTTGGAVAAPFSTTSYSSLSNAGQNLITNGSRGGDQKFAVKYKATPGFAYPAGTYTVDVVYTATQQ